MAPNNRFATSRLTSAVMESPSLVDLKCGCGRTLGHMTTPARERFNEFYENGTPPWVIGEPQLAIVALEQTGRIRGKVLDPGCGLGEHTILLTRLGYDV